ncbi:hypothetical protein EV368DRAFT_51039 [Lentinula lateritia]|nr:hypothetical protein EV368DRAFT_51039 [Lentinula lateritia]
MYRGRLAFIELLTDLAITHSSAPNCLYFKRASDGEIMWDKRKKIDVVFGSSGVGAG